MVEKKVTKEKRYESASHPPFSRGARKYESASHPPFSRGARKYESASHPPFSRGARKYESASHPPFSRGARKFAVVKIGGAQELVREGDLLEIPRAEGKEGSKFKVKDVLLLVSLGKLKIGTPLVAGAEVTFKVLEHNKGKKVEIRKLRAKSRYRRKTGHRQLITKLRVEKIKS